MAKHPYLLKLQQEERRTRKIERRMAQSWKIQEYLINGGRGECLRYHGFVAWKGRKMQPDWAMSYEFYAVSGADFYFQSESPVAVVEKMLEIADLRSWRTDYLGSRE